MQSTLPLIYWRDLLHELIARDLKIRYQRSVLGLGWTLLNPLSQLAIFAIVFTSVLPLNIPYYTTFVFAGVLSWSWLSSTLGAAAVAITANPELVRRPGFPVNLLPLLAVSSNGVHFLLALPLLLICALIEVGVPGISIIALPIVILVQGLFTLSLSYFLAASHVYFRDTQHAIGIVLMLGFYVTPIFYRPIEGHENLAFLHLYNPMALIIGSYRDILIQHRWPSGTALAILTFGSLIALAGGLRLFKHVSISFAEEI